MSTWDRFDRIVVVDTEYYNENLHQGNPIVPACICYKELISGETHKQWLYGESSPTLYFPIDDKTLYVCFYGPAEMGVHLSLNWKRPANILDLFAEFRCFTNGKPMVSKNRLVDACYYFGIPATDETFKEAMQQKVLQ
jgi:hypothetical protein